MTHPIHTPASRKSSLALPDEPSILDERSRRARTERMSVLALGEGLYEVGSESDHTYLVDVEAGRCTCPDHVFRDARCKHVRRVAIEITGGRTPPPGKRAAPCGDCDRPVFVREDAPEPVYCDDHTLAPGDTVRDRETGDRLTVVDSSELRADSVRIPEADCTVADYATNTGYEPDAPVVGAVYPHARIARNGPVPPTIRVYTFPRTRLEKADAGETSSDAQPA